MTWQISYIFRRWLPPMLLLVLGGAYWLAGGCRMDEAGSVTPVLEKVYDGDTVKVRGYGRCRILGIDTPEIWKHDGDKWVAVENTEPNAHAASEWLATFLQKPVIVETKGKDRFDRWLIRLTLPGGIDAAAYIREQGWEK